MSFTNIGHMKRLTVKVMYVCVFIPSQGMIILKLFSFLQSDIYKVSNTVNEGKHSKSTLNASRFRWCMGNGVF